MLRASSGGGLFGREAVRMRGSLGEDAQAVSLPPALVLATAHLYSLRGQSLRLDQVPHLELGLSMRLRLPWRATSTAASRLGIADAGSPCMEETSPAATSE